jgi:hypothetical protein
MLSCKRWPKRCKGTLCHYDRAVNIAIAVIPRRGCVRSSVIGGP